MDKIYLDMSLIKIHFQLKISIGGEQFPKGCPKSVLFYRKYSTSNNNNVAYIAYKPKSVYKVYFFHISKLGFPVVQTNQPLLWKNGTSRTNKWKSIKRIPLSET